MEERSRTDKEEVDMGGPIDFAPGMRERLVRIKLLSEWDDGSAEARERHDEEIRKKYGRPDFQERCERIRARLAKEKDKYRPVGKNEEVCNPWVRSK